MSSGMSGGVGERQFDGASTNTTARAKGGSSASTFVIPNASARSYRGYLYTTIYGTGGGSIICTALAVPRVRGFDSTVITWHETSLSKLLFV